MPNQVIMRAIILLLACNTSSFSFQKVYWKCIYDFYQSAIFTNKNENLQYLFITNVKHIPKDIDGIDFQNFFQINNIEIIYSELTYQVPKDWHGAWRNQFYVFDVLDKLKKTMGNFLILDSDCLIMKSLRELFDEIDKKHIICYNCGYSKTHEINGINEMQMSDLYNDFYNEKKDINYKGGEFIALNNTVITNVLEEFYHIFKLNYKKYNSSNVKLNEEAHFLSLIYSKLGYDNDEGNKYIKRMWTAFKFDNIKLEDCNLPIWHLPAEKKYAFSVLFNWFTIQQRTLMSI